MEYPKEYTRGTEPFYPVNDDVNNKKYRPAVSNLRVHYLYKTEIFKDGLKK